MKGRGVAVMGRIGELVGVDKIKYIVPMYENFKD